jgi:Protein of unknown function (DUF2905)
MSPARMLMLTGALLFVAGAAWWLVGRTGGGSAVSWIGRLPGDIRVEKPHFRFYFPLATCLLASVVLTALLWLIQRWHR